MAEGSLRFDHRAVFVFAAPSVDSSGVALVWADFESKALTRIEDRHRHFKFKPLVHPTNSCSVHESPCRPA
jgi:hypothetical protein